MPKEQDPDRWARWRFAIIGPLLAAPPPAGELRQALEALTQRHWRHPVSGLAVRLSFATLERWYYAARQANDPVAALRRCTRSDAGRLRRLSAALIQAIVDSATATAEITKMMLGSSARLTARLMPRLTTSCGKTTERLKRPMYRPISVFSACCDMIANGRLMIDAQPMPTTAINT